MKSVIKSVSPEICEKLSNGDCKILISKTAPKCGTILAPNQSYCPFCSKKENDWITTVGTGTQPFYAEWTNKDALTPPTGQYTNPNPSTTISLGDKPKKSDSTTVTFGTPCNIRTWTLE